MDFRLYEIWQLLKHFAGTFRQAQTLKLGGVLVGLESILNENLGIRDKDNLIEAVVCNVEILGHSTSSSKIFYDLLRHILKDPNNFKKL